MTRRCQWQRPRWANGRGGALVAAVLLWAAAAAWASGPINANGTWRVSDGKSSGKWAARFEVTPTGVLSGTIALNGMGDGTPAEVEGTVDDDQIKFGLVSTRADTAAGRQSVCAFEGTIRGVRVKGTFSDAQGRDGRWEGWWNSGAPKVEGEDDPAGPTVFFDQ